MRILRNTEVINRQSSNLMLGELSNMALVLQNQLVIVDYYSIDALSSELVNGFKNIDDYINEDSTVQYNLIQQMPMAGIDNLLMMTDFEDDMGQTIEFTSTGMIFPNTIKPKGNDFFVINIHNTPTIFIITRVSTNIMKDISCFEVDISLKSTNASTLEQLNKQVKDTYRFTVSSLGADKSLVIKNETYFDLKTHINSYTDLCDVYKSLFYDYSRSVFMYKDVLHLNDRVNIIDLMLLKFMYESNIIVYDDVITYANNNYNENFETIFIDTPPVIDMHNYKISIFNRFVEKDIKNDFSQNRYCTFVDYSPQISKFLGIKIKYSENYSSFTEDQLAIQFNIFDDVFVDKIKTNIKYTETDNVNYKLRNSLISYFNNEQIDFNDIEISYEKSVENFYLIPILLYIYKGYITSLK